MAAVDPNNLPDGGGVMRREYVKSHKNGPIF